MRKKTLYTLLIILGISFAYTLYYFEQYSIENEEEAIHNSLVQWENRARDTKIELDILDITQIDSTNSYIAIFETADNNVGFAQLLKGWNGKYKIKLSGWGTNLVSYVDIKTDDGMYGILVGKNPGLEIDYIVAEAINNEFAFKSSVTNDEKFVKYKKLPSSLKTTFLPNITLYDENDKVINPL